MDTATVIGGGPAGLVAAATLADAGVAVTLLEAKASLGGRAATDHQQGFALNQGPHALYAGSCAMRELKRLGVDPPRWNPTSATRSLIIRDGAAIRPVRGWGTVTRLAMADAPAELTAREWIAANVDDEEKREFVSAFVRVATFVADFDALPADVAQAQLRLAAWPGVRYLKGGWQWMVDALASQATAHGAKLHRRAAVRAIERDGDRWLVSTDERDHPADAVIVAAGLPAAFGRLVPGLIPPGPPAEVSVLDLGLSKLPRKTTFAIGTDKPTYYSKHSPPDQKNGVLMTAMSYVAAPEADLERIADDVHPGWRDALLLRRHLPKMTPIGAVASPTRRPGVEVEPGLFAAADWIGGEGWLVRRRHGLRRRRGPRRHGSPGGRRGVTTDAFEPLRPRLFAIAYGMLGDRGEAEDVVQDAWLRLVDHRARPGDPLRNPEAFLVTVTTRLAIDRLRSARVRRETYVGPWLPEPVVTDPAQAGDPSAIVAEAEQLSLALLTALERLNPVERAVLLLRDVFDFEYAEIGAAVDKSPANCRQIAARAREHAGEPARRRPVSPEEEQRVLTAFVAAVESGDVAALTAVLAADANTYSDGGGVVPAARKVIYGAAKTARLLVSLRRKLEPTDLAFVRVNGDPGVRISGAPGTASVMALEIADGVVVNVRIVNNPEKLTRLGLAGSSPPPPP